MSTLEVTQRRSGNGANKKQLDLPFFKEWTGVDVKTRVENIEFVYGELTKRKSA